MSKFTNLVLVLSLAACEHAAPAQNVAAPTTQEPVPTPGPEPAAVVEAAPATPAVANKPVVVPPGTPTKPAIKAGDPPPKIWVDKPGCRPGSRIPCRWREEDDERTQPRVTQKPAP